MRAHGGVDLPAPGDAPTMSLGQALEMRRSSYSFAPLSITELSTLLRWALGPGRTVRTSDGTDHVLSLHPTAGGLRSLTTYVVTLDEIGELPTGIHVHDPARHGLDVLSIGDMRAATAQCLVQPEFVARASVLVVLVGELAQTLPKYGTRHYRTLHVDAGIAAQNLYLVCAALTLACCAVSGFHDERLSALLRLGETSIPLLTFAVGAGDRRQDG